MAKSPAIGTRTIH